MSYLAKRGSVYYFRRIVPDDLRSALGKREIMLSLRTKDREEAKRLIPAEIIKSDALFAGAQKGSVSDQGKSKPLAAKSAAQLERERLLWEADLERSELRDQALSDQESEIEELEPLMNALAAGKPVDASPADVARAVQLLVVHEREMADIERDALASRTRRRALEAENQAVECSTDKPAVAGKGVYLDTDIVDLWAAERSPAAKTKDSLLISTEK